MAASPFKSPLFTKEVFRSDPLKLIHLTLQIFKPSYGHEKLRSLVGGYDEFNLSRRPRKLDLNIELWFKKG